MNKYELEPENNELETFQHFKNEIVHALVTDSFYQLMYPTDAVNCLEINDIVDEMFDNNFTQKTLMLMMSTKSDVLTIELKRSVKTLSIESLAVTWANHETSASIKAVGPSQVDENSRFDALSARIKESHAKADALEVELDALELRLGSK